MKDIDPIRPQTPSINKIQCATCVYRDKTTLVINGTLREVGVIRNNCKMYSNNIYPYGKPRNILFNNAKCEYYVKDEEG